VKKAAHQKRNTLNRSCSSTHSVPSPADAVAGEAGNDDIENGYDTVDDGFDDCGDTVNDGHKAIANSTEDTFDLGGELVLLDV